MKKTDILGLSSYIYCAQICSIQHEKSIGNKIFSLKFPKWHDEKKTRRKVHIDDALYHEFFCAYCVTKN